jgi:alkyl hydroperoxide reductase subunit F
VEVYPVAESYRVNVQRIEHEGALFQVHTEDARHYRGRSVIFSAGKRYRRLNVPGEDRFIGRGVAWCATCDAPLFQGKRIAVVGGGNSAFTAVRDLLRYAKELHLIHLSDKFDADPVLVDEISRAKDAGKVRFHLHNRVREYLGNEQLVGIRLVSVDGEARYDLAVEGVFLEIGLEPNSAPVATLVALNERGEVPVNRDQSTMVPGLFAAGDVTDEREKQIVVAAGAGAKAALAADRYLSSLGAQSV